MERNLQLYHDLDYSVLIRTDSAVGFGEMDIRTNFYTFIYSCEKEFNRIKIGKYVICICDTIHKDYWTFESAKIIYIAENMKKIIFHKNESFENKKFNSFFISKDHNIISDLIKIRKRKEIIKLINSI